MQKGHILLHLLQDQANLAKPKVSFVFRSTKDLQKMPLRKLSVLHTLFLESKVQINKKIYRTIFFMSKQASLPKISLILQKIKISPKSDTQPFCKVFQLMVCLKFWEHKPSIVMKNALCITFNLSYVECSCTFIWLLNKAFPLNS